MEMPKPTEAHKRLEQLAGSWVGSETMHPSQWDPAGGTATARIDNRVALNGFNVIGDYEQQRNGVVTYSGHSVWTYDGQTNQYALYWFDCMGMPPDIFRGRLDGNKLTLISVGPMGHFRMSYQFVADGQLRSQMDVSKDGDNWNVLFEGTYARQG